MLINIFIAKCQIKYYHTLSENADNNHKCFCDVFLFMNICVSHFVLHTITYVFSIFIITNKCTINITKVYNTPASFYITYTPTCFNIPCHYQAVPHLCLAKLSIFIMSVIQYLYIHTITSIFIVDCICSHKYTLLAQECNVKHILL